MALRDLLKKVAEGRLSIDEAERQIKLLALEDIAGVLRLNIGREVRRGIPEVVLAEYKSVEQLRAAINGFLEVRGRAIVSRLRDEHLEVLE